MPTKCKMLKLHLFYNDVGTSLAEVSESLLNQDRNETLQLLGI